MKIPNLNIMFLEVHYELNALKKHISIIESQLPMIIKSEQEKAKKAWCHDEKVTDEAIIKLKHYEINELVEIALPKYFRSSILVTLWAIFESAIHEIAKVEMKQQKLNKIFIDSGNSFFERFKNYYKNILKLPLETDGKSWQHLKMFYVFRNAIVHANGQLDNIKNESNKIKIKQWIKDDIGIKENKGNLLFSPEFIIKTYDIINNILKDLINKVKKNHNDNNTQNF